MIKALIFDFDGVIVSSEGPSRRFLQSIAAKHGINYNEKQWKSTRGKTSQKVLEEIIPDNPELIAAILNKYRTEYIEHITEYVEPIKFTVKFIHDYKGNLPIAIASMSSKPTIERVTKHFGIYEKIRIIVSRDEVTHHKPDPEIYIKTAADLKVSPGECLVFEDSVIGVKAANNANMPCSVILNGENRKEEFDGMKINSFVSSEQDLMNIAPQR